MTLSASYTSPHPVALTAPIETSINPGRSNIQIGVSSWSDRSLTHESNWYPKRSMRAAERIAYYAEHFPIVEMETTYRFPPTRAVAQQWIDRTPDGFQFDIQAWSLFTGQPTMPNSLWEDLFDEVRPDRRDRPRLYMNHLSPSAVEECWSRFRHSLEPLADAGRLGTVIFRYPRWFSPSESKREVLAELRYRMGDLPVAIQFANPNWVQAEFCEATFNYLEQLDLSFVCVDTNDDDPRGLDGAAATTNDIGIVRLLGRRDHSDDDEWTPDWRGYRYTRDEMERVAKRVSYLASCCRQLHVIFCTTWRDDSVVNAELLQEILRSTDVRAASW
jgi:uncharacterized protein YecE (DUF72 family)